MSSDKETRLKPGDYVYAVYGWDSDPKRTVCREKVNYVGPKQVVLDGVTSLAYDCKSRFSVYDIGVKFGLTPEEAIAIYRRKERLREEAALRELERARRNQEHKEFLLEWTSETIIEP